MIKSVLEKQLEKIKLNEKEFKELEEKAKKLYSNLEKNLKKRKIRADVFVGGSLAKKTLLKKDIYDIDIFVRFDKKYKDNEISRLLEKALGIARKVHGSRDYFQIRQGKVTFEIIPVIKIKNAKEARNVTDLSYFHVSYVKNKIDKNKKLADEIMLAKSFSYANKCYGAESYIKGFSGYALELLVIYYKSFMNFIKAVAKAKEKIVLDPEKHYKNKQEILLNLNEAKLASAMVFVDPTFKERNVLAALSQETFLKFKDVCKKFLAKPSTIFFEESKIDKKDYNLIIKAGTNKQEGAIAGSKLLKFFKFLQQELSRYFEIKKSEFNYNNEKAAYFYFKIKPRRELILSGPPINAVENVLAFRKKHKSAFIKQGKVYAKEKINTNPKKFINDFKIKNKDKMKDMGINELKIS